MIRFAEIGAAGGVVVSAEDMVKWINVHLNKSDLVIDDVVKEMYTTTNIMPENDYYDLYIRPTIPVTYEHHKYGLGLMSGYYRGENFLLKYSHFDNHSAILS